MSGDAIASALRDWRDETGRLVALLRSFPAVAWRRPSRCGAWTNRELLTHLATAYTVRCETLTAVLDGRAPSALHEDDLNKPLVARFASTSVEEMIGKLVRARAEVAALIARLPADSLDRQVAHAGRSVVLSELLNHLSDHDRRHAEELSP